MRVLHTSDWHIGRTVRGRSREEEYRAVLGEIVDVVKDERVDLVLVAGDIFDHAAPSADDEWIAYETLRRLAEAGAQVVLIAGNHDHPRRLDAVAPFLKIAHIQTGALMLPVEHGGCAEVVLPSGEKACIALMPWLKRSNIILAEDLMSDQLADHQSVYVSKFHENLDNLSTGFKHDAVNIILSHVVFTGILFGGGERQSETAEDYWIPQQGFDVHGAQYVALGHIHKQQKLNLQVPAWYCGSPLQLDFGEEEDKKGVLVFEAQAGLPVANVRSVPLTTGRRMLTVPGRNYRDHAAPGSLDHLRQLAASGLLGDAYLRVVVSEPARPNLADEVRDLLPNAVEVTLEKPYAAEASLVTREGMRPRELLATYFEQHKVKQDGVLPLFDELMEEELASPSS